MSVESENNAREVSVVKRHTNTDSEDFLSIQLRSSEDSIDELLSKAMNASSPQTQVKSNTQPGIQ